MSTDTTTEHTLEVRQVVKASPARVYRAWTEPELLAQWFAPSPEFSTVVHEADARVGGSYRIEMKPPQGPVHTAVGQYQELDPPRRLVFTWRWEEQPPRHTVVTVDLKPHAEGTEVTLTHTLFTSAEDRDHHQKGWEGCLQHLAGVMGS
jgi:uncharacterized protein YndB with AHSA1/START domain